MMITKLLVRGFRSFREAAFDMQPGINIVVGPNEGGKSTLLEAITMVFRGSIGGRRLSEELNPYWFNIDNVKDFFSGRASATPSGWPEILIEAYLAAEIDDPHLQKLSGSANELKIDSPGLRLRIAPSTDFSEELEQYREDQKAPRIIPSDYYEVEWESFAGTRLARVPRGAAVAVIDSKTIRSTSGLDYHTRQLLRDYVDDATGASISIAMRAAREQVTESSLSSIRAHVDKLTGRHLHDKEISLQMDQSSGAAWQNSVVPTILGVPFALAGEGQQASVKVALALAQSRESTRLVLIEEPENHLSHTRLRRLLARIDELSSGRQVIVTTHSSFVLNRLGLQQLLFVADGRSSRVDGISHETVQYFKKLPGYDSLRVVLAEKAVLVEGPSDELVFTKAYMDKHSGKMPLDDGIDVISMGGLSFRRALELAAALDRHVAVVRDNDGKDIAELEKDLAPWLSPGRRQLFLGHPEDGYTLEPQILAQNGLSSLNAILGRSDPRDEAALKWMASNKTESALRILEDTQAPFVPPCYISDAVDFVS